MTGGHLYLGLGDFAATAIAQDPATSLATDPRYARRSPPRAPPTRVSCGSTSRPPCALACRWAPGRQPVNYETDIKPWVDALDSFMATATVDGDIASLKALLFVK